MGQHAGVTKYNEHRCGGKYMDNNKIEYELQTRYYLHHYIYVLTVEVTKLEQPKMYETYIRNM